jgi:hypothetical protein
MVLGSPNEDYWAISCVTEARKGMPLVTDAASAILTKLLQGLLSERALTPGELTILAKQLIGDMISSAPPNSAGTKSLE